MVRGNYAVEPFPSARFLQALLTPGTVKYTLGERGMHLLCNCSPRTLLQTCWSTISIRFGPWTMMMDRTVTLTVATFYSGAVPRTTL